MPPALVRIAEALEKLVGMLEAHAELEALREREAKARAWENMKGSRPSVMIGSCPFCDRMNTPLLLRGSDVWGCMGCLAEVLIEAQRVARETPRA